METKPGPKTTEFWVTLVPVILGLAMTLGWLKPEHVEGFTPWMEFAAQILGAVMAALSGGAYAISRGVAKSSSTPDGGQ